MVQAPDSNIDPRTVEGFGREWSRFDQSALDKSELRSIGEQYFKIFPLKEAGPDAEGFDLGCGSGRWARLIAPSVRKLHCIDASDLALQVARRNLSNLENCVFHHASVDSIPLADKSMDFGYSLGVLHHVPDTRAALRSCIDKLKIGAPFLLYLYYAFDNRPFWFRWLWKGSDLVRLLICRSPHWLRWRLTTLIAAFVYWPMARAARLAEIVGLPVSAMPLSFYRSRSFYTMRTDALDRFGTSLEQRFTAREIRAMMESSGLDRIVFSQEAPFWCAVGYRA